MAPTLLGATSRRGAGLGPGFTRTDSATVTAAPRPPLDTTATWLPSLIGTPSGPDSSRPDPGGTRMAPEPLSATSRRSARLGPVLACTDSATVPVPPPTTAGYAYDMTSYRIHGGRDPAALAPARPVVPRPGHNRHARRLRLPRHSAPRNSAAHGSARLDTHRLGDRDGGLSTAAVNDYDIAAPSRHNLTTLARRPFRGPARRWP
jgi:hypothetical protein